MILYNLRLVAPNHYMIAKFSDDFNVDATYNLTEGGRRCDCPAGSRSVILKPCKHRRMLPYMLGAVNTDRFYCYETGQWHHPIMSHADNMDMRMASEPPTLASEASVNEGEGSASEPAPPTPQLRRRV